MGILLGLLSALCWGTADFVARDTTRRIGTYCTQFYLQLFSFAMLTLFLFFSGGFMQFPQVSTQVWLWMLVAGLINILSSLAMYRAFEIGILAIVSPIVASYAIVTVILAVFSGEVLNKTRAIGIMAALVGVVMAAAHHSETEIHWGQKRLKLPPGVGWAALAALGFGVSFWILGLHINPVMEGVWPVWMLRVIGGITLFLLTVPLRQNITPPRGLALRGMLAITVLDTLAYIAFTFASTNDQLSVVSVLVSLFSAVTVVLAWVLLRERLGRSQWAGIGAIFLGIALVSI